MRLFDRIVATGSLSAAGRELGLSPGAVSQRLKALEDRFAAPLLARSSRALSLTDEGRVFLASARSMLAEAEALEAALASKRGGLSGRLRVAAPVDLGRQVIEPLVMAFQAEHPEVCVELHLDDRLEDVTAGDFDVAFRYGQLQDSTLIARVLCANRRVVVAAPAYLAAQGRPESPGELARHACLVLLRGAERLDRWSFHEDGQETVVAVHGALMVNDGERLRAWAVAGRGLAFKSHLDVRADLRAGRLVEVLADYTKAEVPAQILYPAARRHTPRVRAFVDAAVARFARVAA